MPDSGPTHPKRTLKEKDGFKLNPKAAFVELGVTSCFSFLRGASDAVDLAVTAWGHGYDALGIADLNTMAGVVRLHSEALKACIRPIIGCRVELVSGEAFLAYPRDRAAYGRLCTLLSKGKMHDVDGEWQAKGVCDLTLGDLAAHAVDVQLIALPGDDL
ncbi:MAG: PHP domain-containing protein, partial [Pseudomonadota bacterium]